LAIEFQWSGRLQGCLLPPRRTRGPAVILIQAPHIETFAGPCLVPADDTIQQARLQRLLCPVWPADELTDQLSMRGAREGSGQRGVHRNVRPAINIRLITRLVYMLHQYATRPSFLPCGQRGDAECLQSPDDYNLLYAHLMQREFSGKSR